MTDTGRLCAHLQEKARLQGLAVWVIAERSGLEERTIRSVLDGKASIEMISKVGRVLGVQLDWVPR